MNSGMRTGEEALHRAVLNLERQGIGVITYQDSATGRVTVRNKADVAVRRHVHTQIAQDGLRMTEERMERLQVTLVEVSSHPGARPEHAEWQGRCYSLKGAQVIDGTEYPDLREATGYGTVTGLGGANCRHSFGPYRHGAPRMYDPDPHPWRCLLKKGFVPDVSNTFGRQSGGNRARCQSLLMVLSSPIGNPDHERLDGWKSEIG